MSSAREHPVRRIVPALLAVLTLLLLSGGPALAQVKDDREGVSFFDTGPLRIPEQFILGAGFLKLEPGSADVLARGEWQVEALQSITNNWTSSDVVEEFLERGRQRQAITLAELRSIDSVDGAGGLFFADGELYRSQVALRYGLGAGFQVAVTVPYVDFRGGFGDNIIQETHDSLGVSQGGRLGVPQDRYTIYVRDRDGREVFRQGGPDSGVGDVTVALKKRFFEGERWLVAAEGIYKVLSLIHI